MRASDRHGFTLIELSIVLVIIGLVAAGILVGKDLIRTAELRGDIREIEKIDAAVTTFRLKYNCLPGDCANATQFLEGAFDGDGNGLIETYNSGFPPPDPSAVSMRGDYIGQEVAYAIDDIASAHLIAVAPFDADDPVATADPSNALPRLPSGGWFMVREDCNYVAADTCYRTGRHTYRLGTQPGEDGFVQTAGGQIYSASDALYIDTKTDNGNAVTGRTTAAGAYFDGDDSEAFAPFGFVYLDGVCSAGAPSVGLQAGTCQYDPTVAGKRIGLYIRAAY
jgi:prepilin-type N-terminal cleavage/methylation domain-containing protein